MMIMMLSYLLLAYWTDSLSLRGCRYCTEEALCMYLRVGWRRHVYIARACLIGRLACSIDDWFVGGRLEYAASRGEGKACSSIRDAGHDCGSN